MYVCADTPKKKWLLDKIKPVTENSNNAVRRSTRLASRNITPADPDAANTGVYLHSYTQENLYCNFDPQNQSYLSSGVSDAACPLRRLHYTT